jgi:hypothetical protein
MVGWYGQDSSGSGYGLVEGCYEHGNEPSGSTKMLGNSSVAERLVASQQRLRSMGSVHSRRFSYTQ